MKAITPECRLPHPRGPRARAPRPSNQRPFPRAVHARLAHHLLRLARHGLQTAATTGTSSSGYAQPYVNNTYKASTTVTTGDKLRIAVESGVVKFYKNDALVYPSTVSPGHPLKACFTSSLDDAGLTGATIAAN